MNPGVLLNKEICGEHEQLKRNDQIKDFPREKCLSRYFLSLANLVNMHD